MTTDGDPRTIGDVLDRSDLLTEDELRALELSGELANLIYKIIYAPSKSAPVGMYATLRGIAANDWTEAAERIHAIQHQIMAQAAARAYPHLFRLMGSKISG